MEIGHIEDGTANTGHERLKHIALRIYIFLLEETDKNTNKELTLHIRKQ